MLIAQFSFTDEGIRFTQPNGKKVPLTEQTAEKLVHIMRKHDAEFETMISEFLSAGGYRNEFISAILADYLYNYNEFMIDDLEEMIDCAWQGDVHSYMDQLIHEYHYPENIIINAAKLFDDNAEAIIARRQKGEEMADFSERYFDTINICNVPA